MRLFTAPNCFASHVMNAFNDGTRIYFDTPQAAGNMFPFFPDVDGAPFDPAKADSRLTRWSVDMDSASGDFRGREVLSDFVGEFPRIDERYATEHYRHGWMLGFPMGPGSRSSLAHIDLQAGKSGVWSTSGETRVLQEPCFIPRSPQAPEGDGYIAQIQTHTDDGLSDLLLFDALHVAEGPIATIHLPLRMRFGFHGNWVPALSNSTT
jgi:carotenoid cleavage dioxygenase